MNSIGGKILGEGQAGIVQEIKYKKCDKNTLFFDLEKSNKKTIKLYGINNKEHISLIDKIKLIKIINNLHKNIVVKKFKNDLWFLGSNLGKHNFKNELNGYKQLLKIFGENNIINHTSIKPLFIYNNKKVYGISFGNTYYTFSEFCYKSLDKLKLTQELYNQLVKNILMMLNILQKNNYIHNDIKPDNIMYCNNEFKLIDWEMSQILKTKNISFKYCGNTAFNHPIKYYLAGIPYYLCKKLMDIEIYYYKKHNWIQNIKSFEKYKKRTLESFDRLLNLNLNNKEIHKKFSKYFDKYAFAINLAYLADKNKLNPAQNIIDKLMKPLEYPS